MKKILGFLFSTLAVLFLFAFSANAQNKTKSSKKSAKVENVQVVQPAWAEMTAFQELFSSTYSAAQKGNFGPIREQSEQLSKLSIDLAKSELPEANDNVEMRTVLGDLTDQCEELNHAVGTGRSDDQIKEQFSRLNNSFQEILTMRDAQQTAK